MDIKEFFNRVTFDEEDRNYHKNLYELVTVLAEGINAKLPDSAEKTLAFRAFQLGLMHIGCALAKQEKYNS